jgi:hypothetical protein
VFTKEASLYLLVSAGLLAILLAASRQFSWRAASHARRRFERKNGGFLRAQFCTEVARSEGFEPPTPRFEVWCSRIQPDLTGRTCTQEMLDV